MGLILHPRASDNRLSDNYRSAFADAVELTVVTAYLTEWDHTLKLNPRCRRFRFIVGKDFGITRKMACEAVLRWLPPKRKGDFRVAEGIDGFHPKALFWKDANGKKYALLGSSNLTRAAFDSNYEANIRCTLDEADYDAVLAWIKQIESESIGVYEWLPTYKEARLVGKQVPGRKNNARKGELRGGSLPLKALTLPRPLGTLHQIKKRRAVLARYAMRRAGLIRLFRRCAGDNITSAEFYEQLPKYWGHDQGDRMQGAGWERQGKHTNFRLLSRSFVRILDATEQSRDDVVLTEIDYLDEHDVPARRAFLSEMLCLRFPDAYPVLNKPVTRYLSDVKYRAPRNASEGALYIDLARRLRFSLVKNPTHPAKNLAELDTVIWLKYRD